MGATQPPNQRGHITLLTWEQGPLGPVHRIPSGHRGSVNKHADQLIDFDQSTNTQHTSEPAPSQNQETAVKFPLSKSHKLI